MGVLLMTTWISLKDLSVLVNITNPRHFDRVLKGYIEHGLKLYINQVYKHDGTISKDVVGRSRDTPEDDYIPYSWKLGSGKPLLEYHEGKLHKSSINENGTLFLSVGLETTEFLSGIWVDDKENPRHQSTNPTVAWSQVFIAKVDYQNLINRKNGAKKIIAGEAQAIESGQASKKEITEARPHYQAVHYALKEGYKTTKPIFAFLKNEYREFDPDNLGDEREFFRSMEFNYWTSDILLIAVIANGEKSKITKAALDTAVKRVRKDYI